jgi:hypothetical protein
MKKFINTLFVTAFILGVALTSAAIGKNIGANPVNAFMVGFVLATVGTLANTVISKNQNCLNGIAFIGPAKFTDTVYEEIMTEIYMKNKTIANDLVRFMTDVKASGRIRAISATVADQAYSNTPSASGSITLEEREVTPVKREFYDTFDYETIRQSSMADGMSAGAANIINDEFTTAAMGVVGGKASRFVESRFWNAATSASKTAVAALTAGTLQTEVSTAEKAYVAAAPAYPVDGIITKLIYSDAAVPGTFAVGSRIKVAGTTISATNIQDEVNKVYAAIPDELIQDAEASANLVIFMPHVNKKFINQHNNIVTNYKNAFLVEGEKYSYNGVPIEFVPVPANVMLAANKLDLVWTTDLLSDLAAIEVDRLPKPAKNFFYEIIYTLESWIFYQGQKVLYVG